MKRSLSFLLAMILFLTVFGSALADDAEDNVSLEYRSLGSKLYALGNTGYVVEKPDDYYYKMDKINKNAVNFNTNIPSGQNVKKFLYFVESSRSVLITKDMSAENEAYAKLCQWYEMDGYDTLPLDSYTDFLDHFYMTDHHWNYKGSYQGYTEIIRMMLGEDEPLIEPLETVVFDDLKYNGSNNARLKQKTCKELFTVYRFSDFAECKITVNGKKKKTYGMEADYFAGHYSKTAYGNHYGTFYGGDVGELIIDTNRPDKPNLLLFSNSFSNAVDMLLAQHFNKTYIIDPRHYKEDMGTFFHAQRYITKNEIDYVLVLGDLQYFTISFNLE